MSDQEINQQQVDIPNDESQSNSNADNSKSSCINFSHPPPPSCSSDDDHDYNKDSIDDGDYFEYEDCGDELMYGGDSEIETFDEDQFCSVCNKVGDPMIGCTFCRGCYCRRDAAQHIHFWRMIGLYACITCTKRIGDDLGVQLEMEWRGGKVLTLEMLCAFNIARKMWEIYEPPWDTQNRAESGNSLSVMNSVDQPYADSPPPIRNLIKRAVFLIGLELEFLERYLIFYPSVQNTFAANKSSFDVSIGFDNEKNDDSKKNNNRETKDINDYWKAQEIEWTPQFTIKKLDDFGV